MPEYIDGDDPVTDAARYVRLEAEDSQESWYALRELRQVYERSRVNAENEDGYDAHEGRTLEIIPEEGPAIIVGFPAAPPPPCFSMEGVRLPDGWSPQYPE
ncbi:MAG: hypothetical protein SVW77_02155 [Candidatus Nanohaloarchaea archaeon]|nr:hypothetical protein [Candidatus Nanohaloarchaea archaeon]